MNITRNKYKLQLLFVVYQKNVQTNKNNIFLASCINIFQKNIWTLIIDNMKIIIGTGKIFNFYIENSNLWFYVVNINF